MRAVLPVRPEPWTRVPISGRPSGLRVLGAGHGQADGGGPEARPGHRARALRLRKGKHFNQSAPRPIFITNYLCSI